MTPTPLLLIEDTPSLQMVYETILKSAGHLVHVEDTAQSGLAAFRKLRPPVVLLDLMLPDGDGLDLMTEMLALSPQTCVIVITANGSINKAVKAMRIGAHEFLVKPFDEQKFLNAVDNALSAHGIASNGIASNGTASNGTAQKAAGQPLGAFIGTSPVMQAVYAKITSVARSMATVFITGESGTGKELCAQAVHDLSNRAHGPFIALNCGAIPSDLLESEVFGHLKGSFTGAISEKIGAAAAADGGTLFLDEVCEMDMNLQTKLLRFLQTSTIQPVGATRPRKVNVRILCATNRDPMEAVRRGQFREDLYYRLHVVPIHLPPLRDRGADVMEIATTSLKRFAAEEGRTFTGFEPDVVALLQRHAWPGNVRQLLNVLWNVVVLNDGPLVTRSMLPDEYLRASEALPHPGPVGPAAAQGLMESLDGQTLAQIEQYAIERAIARHGGSLPKAARELDVSPSTLYRKREAWARPVPPARS